MPMPMSITPYSNESDAITIGGLTVENRVDRIAIYGDIDITRDRRGLNRARDLMDVLQAVVDMLEAEKNLPEIISLPDTTDSIINPFE